MNLDEALIGLKAYKEVDQRMALLWHSIDDAIVGPRTNLQSSTLPAIEIQDVSTRKQTYARTRTHLYSLLYLSKGRRTAVLPHYFPTSNKSWAFCPIDSLTSWFKHFPMS